MIVAEFEVTPPAVDVTVEVPTANAVANPVLEIDATELGRAFHVEFAVTSPVVPSLYVAVAVNWTVVGPRERLSVWVSGWMVTLATCLVATVTPVVAITLPLEALTVALPRLTPVRSPPLVIVAMLVGVVDQVTWLVTSPVVLLPKVAVAVYCCVTLGATIEFAGKIWIAVILLADGKNWPQLVENASAKRGTKTARNKDFFDTQIIVPLARCMAKGAYNNR